MFTSAFRPASRGHTGYHGRSTGPHAQPGSRAHTVSWRPALLYFTVLCSTFRVLWDPHPVLWIHIPHYGSTSRIMDPHPVLVLWRPHPVLWIHIPYYGSTSRFRTPLRPGKPSTGPPASGRSISITRGVDSITRDVGSITRDVGSTTRDVGYITRDVGAEQSRQSKAKQGRPP
eukprot:gene16240-biopygen3756